MRNKNFLYIKKHVTRVFFIICITVFTYLYFLSICIYLVYLFLLLPNPCLFHRCIVVDVSTRMGTTGAPNKLTIPVKPSFKQLRGKRIGI